MEWLQMPGSQSEETLPRLPLQRIANSRNQSLRRCWRRRRWVGGHTCTCPGGLIYYTIVTTVPIVYTICMVWYCQLRHEVWILAAASIRERWPFCSCSTSRGAATIRERRLVESGLWSSKYGIRYYIAHADDTKNIYNNPSVALQSVRGINTCVKNIFKIS